MKTTQCPLCEKKIVYSRDNQYLRCEDLNCKYIISNLCVACHKGKYIHKVASNGFYKGSSFFQCNQCNDILDLQILIPTDKMNKD